MKVSKSGIAIIVLAVLLVITVGYIVIDSMQEARLSELQAAWQQGYMQGNDNVVFSVMGGTNNCQPYALAVQNMTRYVVDLACVQPGG